jgi:aminoglycoside phosphotransferase (APT) family kinase protein
MSAGKMHADEVDTDVPLVRRLLAVQFPHWADLPLAPVPSAGTDNALYRLGTDMVVRLPRIQGAVGDVDKEQRWLPRLAPHLPVAIPVPLAIGTPGAGYPWHWSIYRWLDGQDATLALVADLGQAARDLADFSIALHRIDPTGGPHARRGGPLVTQDTETRAAIAALDGMLDVDIDLGAATAAWDAALRAPAWDGPPVWIHGDLLPMNLLVRQGRLSAIIDWGGLGVGDPAVDVMVAWTMFSAATRDIFREALAVDDATWARGRGWALCLGLGAQPYYHITNPVLADIGRRAIDQVLADHERRR